MVPVAGNIYLLLRDVAACCNRNMAEEFNNENERRARARYAIRELRQEQKLLGGGSRQYVGKLLFRRKFRTAETKQQEAFYNICACGDKKKVEEKLAKGGLNTEFDNLGYTPLVIASYNGHKEVASQLVQHRADVNRPSVTLGTPIAAACMSGELALAKFLLSCKASVNKANCIERSPLIYACSKGPAAAVKFLLDNKANPFVQSLGNQNPLLHAMNRDNVEIIKLLVKNQKDFDKFCLNMTVEVGNDSFITVQTPFLYALFERATQSIAYLLRTIGKANADGTFLLIPLNSSTDNAVSTELLLRCRKEHKEIDNSVEQNVKNVALDNAVSTELLLRCREERKEIDNSVEQNVKNVALDCFLHKNKPAVSLVLFQHGLDLYLLQGHRNDLIHLFEKWSKNQLTSSLVSIILTYHLPQKLPQKSKLLFEKRRIKRVHISILSERRR